MIRMSRNGNETAAISAFTFAARLSTIHPDQRWGGGRA
ncbi:Uncharacterised protein [Amycolatopsis camponoti]|uniref:Uncharacterized protein n=1 Tax=Amycolatopsis camponoti TaxID=2606593 RepID=A0A6I8LN34_9PSEU|nr:Uncharacterised protein [Amycolatopsis camponoti]